MQPKVKQDVEPFDLNEALTTTNVGEKSIGKFHLFLYGCSICMLLAKLWFYVFSCCFVALLAGRKSQALKGKNLLLMNMKCLETFLMIFLKIKRSM